MNKRIIQPLLFNLLEITDIANCSQSNKAILLIINLAIINRYI